VGDEAVAEDTFQQTWLRVTERISLYDRSRPFAPWLFGVARNLALDHLRRRQPESLDEVDEPVATRGPDPLAHAVARERGARLVDAVAGLAPLDREVLSLRFEEDQDLPQLAQTLGVPVPTAKARLYRALGRLRGRLLAVGPAEDWR
jgi:RNA polymerase sigma-70 factor (ECF subfamily)